MKKYNESDDFQVLVEEETIDMNESFEDFQKH